MEKQKSCTERIDEMYKDTIQDLRIVWEAYKRGEDEELEDYPPFYEYGLCFDYVAADTFKDQEQGYFRYQLSWGGPADEFRFYCDPAFNCYRIEYWFLDWYDGASKTLYNEDKEMLLEIFEDFKEIGSVQTVFEDTQE